jgi:hypothetical protein
MNRIFCSYFTNSYLQPPPPSKKSPAFKINQKSYLPFEITKHKRETVVRWICMKILSYESKYISETAVTRPQIEQPLSLALVKVGLPEKHGIFTGLYTHTNTPLTYTHVYSLNLQPAKFRQVYRLFSRTCTFDFGPGQLSRSTDWDISWETDESCFDSR